MTEYDTPDGSASERTLVPAWHGRFYEDLQVGGIYKHPHGRTVTETDNVWFSHITMKASPLHSNEVYASETQFGERIVDGTFLIALVVGMSVVDISQNAVANLGYDSIQHHAPVFHGDTIFAETEILDKRESESIEEAGIVTTETRAYNQNNDLVLTLSEALLIEKQAYADVDSASPSGWPRGIGTQEGDL